MAFDRDYLHNALLCAMKILLHIYNNYSSRLAIYINVHASDTGRSEL